jgi:hypothetical protein
MTGRTWWSSSVQFRAVRKQKRAEIGRIHDKTKPLMTHPSAILLLLSRHHLPQFQHLPIVYLNFKSICGLNHSLDQSPHYLIISGNILMDTPSGMLY